MEGSLYKAAALEGWAIFDCDGSKNGRWQIQGFDTPGDLLGITGKMPPKINDKTAWGLVMAGEKTHHVAARDFIRTQNPKEFQAMQNALSQYSGFQVT